MPEVVQRTFTSGELAPALRSRVDLSKYMSGLALCENFFVRPQGGVYSRPGTRFIGEIGDSTKRARLIPFSFNTEQTYILVFEHLKVRVVKNGAYIESSPGVPFELVTTYTEAELPRLQFTQSADVLTVVHPSHDPANLNRLSDTNWTLTAINYASPVAAPTGLALATVGAGAGTYSKRYRYVVTAVDADGVESLASTDVSISTPSLSTTAGLKLTWNAVTGASYYRVYKEPTSDSTILTGFYGWIGDSEGLSFTDFNFAPIMSDAPPQDRQPFTGADNKPSAVTYYQQRQIFANTNNEPQTCFTSQTGVYNSLRKSSPSRSDDSVTFTIAARQVNEIRHLVPLDSLILMTSGAEWLTTEGQDQVLTPSSVGIKPQSFNGSSWVPPVVVGDTAIYIQEKGSRVRDLAYEFSSDKFSGSDLSIMSEHLFLDYQIEEMTFCAEPYGIVWCVRDDGVLLGLTYQREHNVWGWHHHVTDGVIESVTSVTEGDRDALYMIVRRVVDGSSVRYIERMEPRITSAAEDAFFVDSGLSYDGTNTSATTITISAADYTIGKPLTLTASASLFAAGDVGDAIVFTDAAGVEHTVNINSYTSPTVVTGASHTDIPVDLQASATSVWSFARASVSGLDHLEGEELAILADGNEVTGVAVSAGAITIPRAAVKIHAGLPYTCAIETLDVDQPAAQSTVKGHEISVSKVTIEVESSRGGWLGPKLDAGGTGAMYEIKPRFESDGYDPIALKTFKEEINIDPQWQKGGGVRIEQRSPLPLSILSVIPRVDVGGG